MRDLGWIEGKTFAIESRFANGPSPGALAARKASATIPIVMVTTGVPVAAGLVASLARPGGNVTGITALGQQLNAKRLELIREAVPGVTRVGLLMNPRSVYTPPLLQETEIAEKAFAALVRAFEGNRAIVFDEGERVPVR